MARYKEVEKEQRLLFVINLNDQLVIGTFEHTLSRLIDEKLDLRILDSKFKNDLTGACAIEPRILLKIIQTENRRNEIK